MAYDEGLAETLRDDLAGIEGIAERRMFGGIAFLLHGHMVCGVHSGGGMFRVGKDAEATALELPGVRPMQFTGRRMGGLVEVDDAAAADDEVRARLMRLALDFAGSLPPK